MKKEDRDQAAPFGVAIWGALALLGVLVGTVDATFALVAGRMSGGVVPLYVLGIPLGVLLTVLAGAPLVLAILALRRPLDAGSRCGAVIGFLALLPAVLLLGRWFYHRVPFSGAEYALVAIVVAALSFVWWIAMSVGRRLPATAVRRFLRVGLRGLPALLLALPVLVRVVPALFPTGSRAAATSGANLLLLTVDTLRADALGAYGNPRARTPHLDRLSRASVTFETCIATAPWTLPTLGSIHTGAYPATHRLSGVADLADSVPTLAETCASTGRRTGAFVSNPWLATRSLARGFGIFDVAEKLECLGPLLGTYSYDYLHKILLRVQKQDDANHISQLGIDWIARGRGSWFLWLHYFDPHLPNHPARPRDRLFGPPACREALLLPAVDASIRDGTHPLDATVRRDLRNLYDSEVAYTDGALGTMLRHLEAAGLRESTAIVVTADHGEEFWDHGGYEHGHQMYDELVRVPLLVAATPKSAGRVVSTMTRMIDIAPTALSAAGIDSHAFSTIDLLRGPLAETSAYGEATLYGDEQKFLRSDDWKVVLRRGEHPTTSVFDLRADPAEKHDLAGREPALRDSLDGELRSWIERVGSLDDEGHRVPDDLSPAERERLRAVGYL